MSLFTKRINVFLLIENSEEVLKNETVQRTKIASYNIVIAVHMIHALVFQSCLRKN